MNLNVVKYLVSEVKRQHAPVEDMFGMALAWDYAKCESQVFTLPTEGMIQQIAYLVGSQSGINAVHMGGHNYRWTPITVGGIVTGADPENIPRQMQLLCNAYPITQDVSRSPRDQENQDRWCAAIVTDEVDGFVKQLLDIHPFADGNGRTASIVYNWLMGSLDNPVPLPFYYGDK